MWEKKDEFLDKVFRKSKSINSVRYYKFGVEDFKRYCDEKGVKKVTNGNVYSVLDGYVNHLDKKGLKAKTIKDNMSAVRKFLVYNDIEIDPAKFKVKVTMPKVVKIADEPLTMEAVRTLLMKGRPSPRTRALVLALLSSGMRIGEALSIAWKDVDLQGSPATVRLRADYTKTREARVAYLSDEAAEALRELKRGTREEDLVFPYAGNIWQREKEAGHTFRKTVGRAGLDDKIEGHRIHKIHFHTFRKFFLTKAVDLLGEHAGHALIGHGYYMDTYYKKTEEERKGDYLRLMPHLSVFGKETATDTKTALKEQLLMIAGFSGEEVGRLDLPGIPDEEFQKMVRERLLGAMANNGNHQRVIPVAQVDDYITRGWEFVAVLPNGRAVLRLPN